MAAIYCPPWPKNLEVTTTLYPIDYTESLQVGCSIVAGRLTLVPQDKLEQSHTVLNMTYVQSRWYLEDGPYNDEVENTHTVIGMTYVQTRWYLEDGPYDDLLESTHTVVDMTYIRVLIKADTPDEGLKLAIAIRDTCTMDLI